MTEGTFKGMTIGDLRQRVRKAGPAAEEDVIARLSPDIRWRQSTGSRESSRCGLGS